MKHTASAVISVLLIGLPAFGQSAQTLVIPQVVDGGGWQSTVVITNSSTAQASATLIFHSDTADGNTQPWSPPFLEVGSTTGLLLPSGSTLYLHTPGTAPLLTQGWAEVDSDAGIVAYVIYTKRVPTHQDQDATAPAVVATNRILMPYDDADGFRSALAIVNPTATAQTVSVGFHTTDGLIATNVLPTVPPRGHMAFFLTDLFPVIAGHRGLAEFYSATGTLSMIALRVNPTQSSTSAPVFFQNGAPLITAPPDPGPYVPMYQYQAPRPAAGVQ